LRLGDEGTLGVLQSEAVGDLRGDRLDLYADPPAGDGAMILQLGDCCFDMSAGIDFAAPSPRPGTDNHPGGQGMAGVFGVPEGKGP